jgi:hypothetical protein
MIIPRNSRDYSDSQNTPHEWLPHPKAFTGQVVAQSLLVSGKLLEMLIVRKADARKAVGSILLRSPQAKRAMWCTD